MSTKFTSIIVLFLLATLSIQKQRLLQSLSNQSSFEIKQISGNLWPDWPVDSSLSKITVTVINESYNSIMPAYLRKQNYNTFEVQLPQMKPDSWSSRPAEFVQFKPSRGQTVIIKGLNVDPNTHNALTNLWAFRAAEDVCESNQYQLIVQADLNLRVECDTTVYPTTVFTAEAFEGEWSTAEFLQIDHFPTKSLSMINRTFGDDKTVWNVLEDGESKTAPFKPDWYEFITNEHGIPEYKSMSFDPSAKSVKLGYNQRINWPNQTGTSSVLFQEGSEGNVIAFKPAISFCNELKGTYSYVNGDIVTYCSGYPYDPIDEMEQNTEKKARKEKRRRDRRERKRREREERKAKKANKRDKSSKDNN